MARVTQRQQVVPLVAAAVAARHHMMHVGGWRDPACLLAMRTERMCCQVGSTHTLPPATIATLCSRATLLVMLGSRGTPQRAAHAAHASLHKSSAAGSLTGCRRP